MFDNKKLQLTNRQLEYDLDTDLTETIDLFVNKNHLKLYKPDVYDV